MAKVPKLKLPDPPYRVFASYCGDNDDLYAIGRQRWWTYDRDNCLFGCDDVTDVEPWELRVIENSRNDDEAIKIIRRARLERQS